MFKIWLILVLFYWGTMFSFKHFISGFVLSLFAIHLMADNSTRTNTQEASNIPHIYLYKNNTQNITSPVIKKNVQKVASISNDYQINKLSQEESEMLGININSMIPIDFNETVKNNKKTLITSIDEQETTASLPSETSPWEIAQTNKNNQIQKQTLDSKINVSLSEEKIIDDSISYKVAERIKDSVLFPLSKEILNDENLTPTFIKNSKKKDTPKPTVTTKENKTEKKIEKTATTNKDNNPATNTTQAELIKPEKKENFLSSISSIFSPKEDNKNTTKNTPKYSSQTSETATTSIQTTNKDKTRQISSLYEAIKETQHIEKIKNIQPTELNLRFTPNMAEISGNTLKWLKTFRELAQKNNKKIDIILSDVSTRELQVKRFNLLHDLLTTSNTKPIAIDVWLTDIDVDTFIIRITNIAQEH